MSNQQTPRSANEWAKMGEVLERFSCPEGWVLTQAKRGKIGSVKMNPESAQSTRLFKVEDVRRLLDRIAISQRKVSCQPRTAVPGTTKDR